MALKIDGVSAFFTKLTTAFNNSTGLKEGGSVKIANTTKTRSVKEIIKREGWETTSLINYSGTPTLNASLGNVNFATYTRGAYIEFIDLLSDTECNIQLQIIGGVALGSSIGVVNYEMHLQANVKYRFPYENTVHWRKNFYLIFRDANAGAATFKIKASFYVYQYTYTNNIFAEKNIFAVGDSISAGVNTSIIDNPNTGWLPQVTEAMQMQGIDCKLVNRSIESKNADDLAAAVRAGWGDISNVTFFVIALGTNPSASTGAFITAITYLVNYALSRWPSVKVLVCSPVTKLDAGETTMVAYRAALNTYVTGLSNSRVKYIDMSQSFNAADVQFGVTVGNVHPNSVGHNAMGLYAINYMDTNNFKP